MTFQVFHDLYEPCLVRALHCTFTIISFSAALRFFFSSLEIKSWQGKPETKYYAYSKNEFSNIKCFNFQCDWSILSRWPQFNPLSPNIHIQILQTDLHTSSLRIRWENLINDHGIFSMIILLILITLSLDSVWKLLGENCCYSPLGLKGLSKVMQ